MDELLQKLKKNFSEAEFQELKAAYDFSAAAHEGQKRQTGEPYFIHPCAVVNVLVDLGFDDVSTLVAAFLHDVLEDTPVTSDELEQKFGKEVLELVEGVTKLDKIKFVSAEDEQAENLRKMFFAMAKDYRVIIIKLADRLHNMRTLDALKPEKQIKIATQSLKIYAPLAGRLGLSFVKCELEDLAMRYLYPDDYYELVEFIKTKSKERQQFIEKICDELKAKLQELGIEGEVNGRQKHLYGIYKKNAETREEYRADLRHIRSPRHRQRGAGLLYGAWRDSHDVDAAPGAFQGLYRNAETQRISVAAHDGYHEV